MVIRKMERYYLDSLRMQSEVNHFHEYTLNHTKSTPWNIIYRREIEKVNGDTTLLAHYQYSAPQSRQDDQPQLIECGEECGVK